MASKTSLCNLALRRVGEKTIQSLDEGTKQSDLCNELYEPVMEQVLAMHNWNFALQRAELAQSTTSPAYGWVYSYPLPTSPKCLRVIRMEDTDYEFVVEGRNLLTDEGTCKILYVGMVDDPSTMSPLAQKVFYLSMAVEMAFTLTATNTVLNGLYDQLQAAISEARCMDALEGTVMAAHKSVWLESRYSGLGAGLNRNNVR